MRRFLCFSLCLGLMVSACKKKSLEESVNKAIAKAGGAGGGDGGGDGGGTTVTKKDKAAVLKACLPLINTQMIRGAERKEKKTNALFLRRNTVWQTTAAAPLVVLYVSEGVPLEFTKEHGLGKDEATVTANLNAMAASEVIQDQFVARDDNASGWRVHISYANTNVTIFQSENNEPPEVPNDSIIIYDRENTINAGGVTPRVNERARLGQANGEDYQGGWFECVVNDTTQDVTLKFTQAELTEA